MCFAAEGDCVAFASRRPLISPGPRDLPPQGTDASDPLLAYRLCEVLDGHNREETGMGATGLGGYFELRSKRAEITYAELARAVKACNRVGDALGNRYLGPHCSYQAIRAV
jgi:hypothetical protein